MAPKNTPPSERVDEALRCLGLIAVNAAALEANLARLAARADDAVDYKLALKMPNKKKVQVVTAGLQARRNPNGTERRDIAGRKRAIAWAEEALTLLSQRGDLMHSEWIIARRISDRRAPKEWLAEHLSSGRRTPVDPEGLQLLADQIATHAARFRNIWQFAPKSTIGRTRAEWEALFNRRPGEITPPSD